MFKNLKLSTACLIITLIYQFVRPETSISLVLIAILALIGFESFLEHRAYQKDVDQKVQNALDELKAVTKKTYEDFAKVVEDVDRHQDERFQNMENRLSKLDYTVALKPKKDKPIASGW